MYFVEYTDTHKTTLIINLYLILYKDPDTLVLTLFNTNCGVQRK